MNYVICSDIQLARDETAVGADGFVCWLLALPEAAESCLISWTRSS